MWLGKRAMLHQYGPLAHGVKSRVQAMVFCRQPVSKGYGPWYPKRLIEQWPTAHSLSL